MDNISQYVGEKLLANSLKISVAESCTGGWVSKMMTDIAGSSQWFDRGFVTYTNEAKVDMLGVSESTLEAHGAVSLQTVEEMASGVLMNSLADVSLAISGIAGPGGGSAEKPIGTVCFAWANKQGQSFSEVKLFSGDREAIRLKAANYALEGVVLHFFSSN